MPKVVGIFVDKVKDLIHGNVTPCRVIHLLKKNGFINSAGCCFAGAGGGGFLLAIMKDPKEKPHIKKTVEATPVSGQKKKGGGVWGRVAMGRSLLWLRGMEGHCLMLNASLCDAVKNSVT